LVAAAVVVIQEVFDIYLELPSGSEK